MEERDSQSYVTYLLWNPKISGRTTIDIMLGGLEVALGRELESFVPARDSQDIYMSKGLSKPLAEVVLRSVNPLEAVPRVESMNFYWALERRGFHVISYGFNEDGEKIILNESPDFRRQ